MFQEILSQIDPKVIYLVVGLMIISGIIAIIRKAIKIAITVIIIGVLISTLGPMAKDFQNNYKINTDNGIVTIQIKENTLKFSKDEVKNIEIVYRGVSDPTINVVYKDGIGSINVPKFMVGAIKGYAEKNSIPIVIKD